MLITGSIIALVSILSSPNSQSVSGKDVNTFYNVIEEQTITKNNYDGDGSSLLLYSDYKDLDLLVSTAKKLKCGVNIDKPLTLKKPLDLEEIREIVIKEINNNKSTPLIIGSGTSMYSLCRFVIDKCNYIKVVGGKNIRCEVGTANTLELFADGKEAGRSAVAYSNFSLMRVNNLIISGQNGGWCNENSFIGGTFDNVSISGDYGHNHNVFYNPHLELKGSINISSGHSNFFRDVRFEKTGNVIFGEGTRHNVVERTYFNDKIGNHFNYSNPNVVNNGDFTNVVYNSLDDYDVKDYQIDRNFFVSNPVNGVTVKGHSFRITTKNAFSNVYIPIYRGVGIFVSAISEYGINGRLYLIDDKEQIITEELHDVVVGNQLAFNNGAYILKNNSTSFGFTVYPNRDSSQKIKSAKLEFYSTITQNIESINIKILCDKNYPNSTAIIYPIE